MGWFYDNGDRSAVFCAISGVLTSARRSTSTESFLPAVPVVNRVGDYRLVGSLFGQPAGYFVEPMHWLTTNEATSTVEFKRALHMAVRDEKKRLDTK